MYDILNMYSTFVDVMHQCRRCCHTRASYATARVSCSSERRQRRQMCSSYGVLVEITLHVQTTAAVALSLQESAPHELEHLAVIARVISLSLSLSLVGVSSNARPALSASLSLSRLTLCSRLCLGYASRSLRATSTLVYVLVNYIISSSLLNR